MKRKQISMKVWVILQGVDNKTEIFADHVDYLQSHNMNWGAFLFDQSEQNRTSNGIVSKFEWL